MTSAFVVIAGLAWVALAVERPQLRSEDARDRIVQVAADKPRVWIGIQIQNVEKDYAEALGLPETSGALIVSVAKGGPASSAGLKVGDVVLTVDEDPIENARALATRLREFAPGDVAKLTINRDGQSLPVEVTIKSRP